MTDQERQDWLDKKWIVVPLGRFWFIRRLVSAEVETSHAYPTYKKAKKAADKLNVGILQSKGITP